MRLKAPEMEANITYKTSISSAVRRNAPQEIWDWLHRSSFVPTKFYAASDFFSILEQQKEFNFKLALIICKFSDFIWYYLFDRIYKLYFSNMFSIFKCQSAFSGTGDYIEHYITEKIHVQMPTNKPPVLFIDTLSQKSWHFVRCDTSWRVFGCSLCHFVTKFNWKY